MAINLSNYYSYLNTISSNLTQNLDAVKKSNYDLSAPKETSSDFEMAFLSMLDRSKDAYAKIAESGTDTATESIAATADSQDAGTALYDNLTQILESYDSMRSSASIPKSIQESLFDMLNENNQSEDKSSAYSSELNIPALLQKAKEQL